MFKINDAFLKRCSTGNSELTGFTWGEQECVRVYGNKSLQPVQTSRRLGAEGHALHVRSLRPGLVSLLSLPDAARGDEPDNSRGAGSAGG